MDEKLQKQCRTCFKRLVPKRTVNGKFCSWYCNDNQFKYEGYIKTETGKLYKFSSKQQRRGITNYLAQKNIIHTVRYEQ